MKKEEGGLGIAPHERAARAPPSIPRMGRLHSFVCLSLFRLSVSVSARPHLES